MVTLEKIGQRINQSKWTKIFIALAVIQGVVIIALQAAIAAQNTSQAALLPDSSVEFGNSSNEEYNQLLSARSRLRRIKWENVAFIGFQVWFVATSFDATVYQNAPEVIALAVLNVFCSILGGLEVMDGKRWLGRLNDMNAKYDLGISVTPLRAAYYLEIVLTVLLVVFALMFVYVSYMVVREFGWVIYKKIGPDVGVQKMYRVFQFFVLALKIDVFIEFLVSLFYFIQFAIDGFQWDTWVQLIIMLFILPALYFGRMTVAAESYGRMLLFIAFQFVVVFGFILMLRQTTLEPGNYWYTWICFVIIGMLFALGTAALGAWSMHNFGQGLAPYVQRGDKKKELEQAREELREQASLNSWRIDDD